MVIPVGMRAAVGVAPEEGQASVVRSGVGSRLELEEEEAPEILGVHCGFSTAGQSLLAQS